ncbi:MAG: metal-dependent transcriptional regulator [SAR202 cluster bacterium]|nr:metal-dependent transcriptional regulator [SAR202 cluster bacterium]
MPQTQHKSKVSTKDSPPRLSPATENYLLSIFHLQEWEQRVTMTTLAEELRRLPVGEGLGTSLPSVGGMVRRMARERLVEVTKQKDVLLTSKGKLAAESIVRRHRLAERMVVDLLNLELHKAHVEAHRLEHAISPELELLIEKKLNHPTTCPFGHPIPGSGYTARKNSVTLDKAKPGTPVVIDKVPEDDQALLEYLVANKVIPNQKALVKEAASYRGVITIQVDESDVVVSYEVAERLWVAPA